MRRILLPMLVTIGLLAAACAAQIPPTPTPRATDPAPSGGPSGTPAATDAPGPTDPGASATPEPTGGEPSASPDPSAAPSEPAGGVDPRRIRLALETVVPFDLDQPVYLTHAGDGSNRLFIVERRGRIQVLLPDGTILADPLLDIRDRVDTNGERGLYAVAFHPRFAENGRFFVHWTNSRDESFVEEYRVEGEGTVPSGSARELLRIDHPEWNHKGGWLGFGPDGYLYIAVGDGGGDSPGDPFRNGQDTGTLLGKMLRIDVDGEGRYSIPADNPFADGGGEPEIWAYGLRNPWRASFDRATGDLWIGDVGQDSLEEIDVIPAGEAGLNFGWSDMEGTDCHRRRNCDPSDYVLPVHVYPTGPRGYCSVTGGYVYRGAAYPFLQGAYLYTDYCSGNLHAFDAAAAIETGTADARKVGSSAYNLVSMGEDESGELYVTDISGGRVLRITAVQLP